MKKLALTLSLLMLILALVEGCRTRIDRSPNATASSKHGNAGRDAWDIPREDFERQKYRFAREAEVLGRKIGNGSKDLWIWAKARGALAHADDLKDVAIDIDVENDVVTLSGSVPNHLQKTEAEEIARSIDGVRSVKNDLTVSANTSASSAAPEQH